jgi:hypothetical protein
VVSLHGPKRQSTRIALSIAVTLLVAATLTGVSSPASAQLAAPWDGNPVSPGLGPTYGEEWCAQAQPESNIDEQQDDPLALMPYEAIECTLEQFEGEAAAAGVPDRLDWSVIGESPLGRELLGVVVNALDTTAQRRNYQRWQQLRGLMFTDPAAAQDLLASWGGDVKLPIFIEANIHGNEEEGTDAIMQVIRDLATLPYGANPTVDDLLDHSFLVTIPTANPEGRIAGTRRNSNAFDMNRDLLVQSQPEIRANVAFQQEWLAPVGLAMHGYYSPTLVDGLTKPHNPGIEYDLFVNWNQRRLDANEPDYNAVGMEIQRPVNDWNASGYFGPKPRGPAVAEGWDDWGPFYTQTYEAFYGVDSSTLEMCDSDAGCNGRFGSKRAQYIGYYSSADFWVQNRADILHDQLEIFSRGVSDAERVTCCPAGSYAADAGFDSENHDWAVEYPKAYVIPFVGSSSSSAQRSDAEANRMAKWLMDNGIEVHRATAAFTWNGQNFEAGSYVVWLDQALRGIALTALSLGQDVSDRITQLYAPPGAWSHGFLWGADVVEIPRDASFNPATTAIGAVNPLQGGVRDATAPWHAVTLQGTAEAKAVLDLLRDGIDGEVAEAAFTTSTGAQMPAGSLIFPQAAAGALQSAGQEAGMWFEPVSSKPATTQLDEAPRVAILVGEASPGEDDTSWSLRQIFGPDVGFVTTVTGKSSLQRSPTDPLANFDVIYNTGQGYPASKYGTARARLRAFFERGGGYIGTSVSSANFSFLNNAGPALIQGTLTQGSDSADGGIARWKNLGRTAGPLTGGFLAKDNLYLPANVTWFSSTPSGATVDGRYLASVNTLFIAGLWRDRNAAAANAPIIVHGTTLVGSRYMGLATNPFSRGDAEREWPLVAQAALWSNLTDE